MNENKTVLENDKQKEIMENRRRGIAIFIGLMLIIIGGIVLTIYLIFFSNDKDDKPTSTSPQTPVYTTPKGIVMPTGEIVKYLGDSFLVDSWLFTTGDGKFELKKVNENMEDFEISSITTNSILIRDVDSPNVAFSSISDIEVVLVGSTSLKATVDYSYDINNNGVINIKFIEDDLIYPFLPKGTNEFDYSTLSYTIAANEYDATLTMFGFEKDDNNNVLIGEKECQLDINEVTFKSLSPDGNIISITNSVCN